MTTPRQGPGAASQASENGRRLGFVSSTALGLRATGRTWPRRAQGWAARVLRQRNWRWALGPLVVATLMGPMVLTSRSYASDWPNHLWLVWQQSLNIKTLGHPSYFVQSGLGAFYPEFAFYGGTLYAATGAVASLFGEHPLAAYLAAYALAIAAAYTGWWWLCRQIGLSGWAAHVPAILFVTSAYYVTNVYGRGDFPETVATSAIPLVVAGALHLLRTPRWTPLPVAAFVVAVVFMTGSHSLTLVWAATFLVVVGLVAAVAIRRGWRPEIRRVLATAGVGAAGVGINAWWLLPAIAYHGRVALGADTSISQTWYSKASVLLGVFRNAPNPPPITADVQAQAPVLAIVWALVGAIVFWAWASPVARRMTVGLTAVLVALVWLILAPHALGSLPSPWNHIQFPFRLVTYVTLAACGLVAAVLLALHTAPREARRFPQVLLLIIVVIGAVLSVEQIWRAPSFFLKNRNETFASPAVPPRSWYSGIELADRSQPVVTPSLPAITGGTPLAPRPGVVLPASPFTARYSYPIVVTQAGTVATNVAAGPYLVGVRGATVAGRTPQGYMAIRVSGPPGQHEDVTFTTAGSTPLRAGVLITGASAVAIFGVLLLVIVNGRDAGTGGRFATSRIRSRRVPTERA